MGELSSLLLAIGIFVSAIMSVVNYFTAMHTAAIARAASAAATATAADIKELAVNTNHIKDALVAVTAQSEHAKGVLIGQAQGRAEGLAEASVKSTQSPV